jgi:CHAD domain-containing protein
LQKILDLKLGHSVANIGPTLRGDPEGVHQIRIALRESRANLKLFEKHLDARAVGRFDVELRRFGIIFGAARDWEVFCLETLPSAMADLPAERLWDLHPPAEVERQLAHATVEEILRGAEFTALLLGMAVWADAAVEQPRMVGDKRMGKRLAHLSPSLLDRVARKAKKCGRHAGRLSPEDLRRLRKSLKMLFYDVENLSDPYRRRAVKTYLNRCAKLGAVLGVATDSAVTQLLALKLATDNRPDLARPVDALARWSLTRGRKTLESLNGLLHKFHDAPTFWS